MRDHIASRNPIVAKSDELAHRVYALTKSYPREELFGLVSQMRRAAVSVPVNILEGFARKGTKHYKQFLLVSYGSLQELKYFLEFSFKEKLLAKNDFEETFALAEECAKMLYKTIEKISEG